MDEFSSGQDIADAMGNMLRSFNDAGYELRRIPGQGEVSEPRDSFEELVTHHQLQQVSGPLFRDSHYARAVEEAFKLLNNVVKDKSEIANQDGAGLMRSAFSAQFSYSLPERFPIAVRKGRTAWLYGHFRGVNDRHQKPPSTRSPTGRQPRCRFGVARLGESPYAQAGRFHQN